MKGMIGSGILTLPIVFKQAGLWTGFFLVFLFGFLNKLTMELLVKSAHYLAKKKFLDEKNNQIENGEEILKDKKYINGNEPMNYGEVIEASLKESGFEWSQKWSKPAKFKINFNFK
jgi:hypothetical protein